MKARMKRREFLRSGGTAAFGLTSVGRLGAAFADTRLRVGLVGCGWYGMKTMVDLLP